MKRRNRIEEAGVTLTAWLVATHHVSWTIDNGHQQQMIIDLLRGHRGHNDLS